MPAIGSLEKAQSAKGATSATNDLLFPWDSATFADKCLRGHGPLLQKLVLSRASIYAAGACPVFA